MLSAYGRNGLGSFMQKCFDENKILFFDNKKSQQLRNAPRVQFPDNISNTDFTDNIQRFKTNVKDNAEKGSLAATPSGQTPFSYTSETLSGAAFFGTNISQENKGVNTQSMQKSSKNDTTIKQSIGEGFSEK